jgi:DNA-binding response OmpR family regulator
VVSFLSKLAARPIEKFPMQIPHSKTDCGRLTVLIVEDDADTAASAQAILVSQGFVTSIVGDGASAIAAAERMQPDIVLLDLGLPLVDGYDVARSIRERITFKRPLLIAVTGQDGLEVERRSKDAGIDLHLVKPADWSRLLPLLERFDSIVN